MSILLKANDTQVKLFYRTSSTSIKQTRRYDELQVRICYPLTIDSYNAEKQCRGQFFQVGNVSWLLEEGDETEDWYDFLELYIRRWQHVARRVDEKCNGKRHLRSEKIPHRSLSQIPVDMDAEATKKPMQNITDKFSNLFEREFLFHPYDW